MIPRYSRPEMAAIWDPQTRFRIWFEIEAHASDAMAELGIIPKDAAFTIWEKARHTTFDVARIDEIERETKHDVIAFLTHLAEIVGPQARFVHQGMTSSDILDTCLNVQLTRAADLLIADVEKLLEALKRGEKRVEVGEKQIGGTAQLHREAGVEHVRRGHPEMNESPLGSDQFGQFRGESDHVVARHIFECLDAADALPRVGLIAPLADRLGRSLGDHTQFGLSIAGMRLDLEPDAESGLGRP